MSHTALRYRVSYEYVNPDEILSDVQRVANDLGYPPRIEDYEEAGKYHWSTAFRAFDSWPDTLRAADLDPDERPYEKRVDCDTLIEDLRQVTMDLGRLPTADEMDEHGNHSRRPFVRAFGSWNAAHEAAGIQSNDRTDENEHCSNTGRRNNHNSR